jgi:hypothetical protein
VLGTKGQSAKANALALSGITGLKNLWPLSKFTILAIKTLLRICPKNIWVAIPGIWSLNTSIIRHQFFGLKHRVKYMNSKNF